MKKIILLAVIAPLALSVLGQKQTRNVESFTVVSLGISGELIIRQGNKTEVVLEGSKETLERIETTVDGNRLKIRTKNGQWHRNYSRVKVYVTVKNFEGASVSGSGDMRSDGMLRGENIDLSVSGSGNIDLDLEADKVDMSISGSGEIHIAGKSNEGELTISGSGKLYALDFAAETYNIRISGSGDARVNVSKSITSKISGSGTVRYKGNPDKVYNHSSGSGSIKKI